MHPLVRSQGSGLNITTYRVVSYVLVTAMLACAAYTAVNLMIHIQPNWQPWYAVVLCMLVALDRLYTYRRFRDWMFLSQEWLLRFGTELVVIVLLTRLVVGLTHGWPAFLADIPLWRKDFMTYFFSGEFIMVLMLVMAAWVFSGNFAELLDDIGIDEDLNLAAPVEASHRYRSARERLMSLFFSLGAVLVVFTSLARIDLRATLIVGKLDVVFMDLPALAAGGGSTLLYFMFGLALLSQTQFVALHVRWDSRHIPVNARLAGRWALYSLAFLVVLALVTSLLPTSYSLGPLQLLNYLLNWGVIIFLVLGKLILDIILIIIDFFTAPFRPKMPLPTPTPEPLATPTPDLLAGLNNVGPPPPWWELLQSFFFWGVFLAVLVFSVTQYLRQHRDALTALRKIPGWHLLEQAWNWLGWLFGRAREGVVQVVRAGRERWLARQSAARDLLAGGFMSLRGLDPRQRVAFFYLALVRRAGESGLPRRQSQTPAEYAARLETALPEADADIASLTEAFIEARYTPRPVQPEKAGLVKATWERIRKVLRGHVEGGRDGKR